MGEKRVCLPRLAISLADRYSDIGILFCFVLLKEGSVTAWSKVFCGLLDYVL
jgi:hypothetical protein